MTVSLYAALLAFLFVALSINVIKQRRRSKLAIGDGGDFQLTRRIRAQGNFAEYAPFFILLLGLAEHNGLPVYALHLLGLAFLVGRSMHAYSLLVAENYVDGKLTANPVWRIRGMICTFTVLNILGIVLLVQYGLARFGG